MPVAFPFSPAPPLPAARRDQRWTQPGGSIPQRTLPSFGAIPGTNPQSVEIGQQAVPQNVRARLSGWGDPINLSQTLDLAKLEASVRMSERGDVWQLYTLYRDMLLSWSHLQSVWNVRKMAVVGQPFTILPASKSVEDKLAADHIKQMIDDCENWQKGLVHVLNGQLYPCSVAEKIFEPARGDELLPVRWRFKKFFPVNELLHCYKIPYLPQSILAQPGYRNVYPPAVPSINSVYQNPALIYDPDQWEPDLRLFEVFENGMVNRNFGNVYRPDPSRHLVYHGSASSQSVRDNYGGELRAIAVWFFFATMGRAAFGQFMERFGMPIPIITADMQQPDTIQFLEQAWSRAHKVGAMFLDKNTAGDQKIDRLDVKTESSALAYETWLNFCKGEVTKVILGQELSNTAKATGLGSGVADLQGQVRQDIKAFDSTMLNHALKTQLFTYYLRINGVQGRAPDIAWGGIDPNDAKLLGDTLSSFAKANIEPTDDAMKNLSERVGFQLQKTSVSMTLPADKINSLPDNKKEDDTDEPADETRKPKADKKVYSATGLMDIAATQGHRTGSWSGYDLDGTLAHTGKGNSIGDPIPSMLARLRADLKAGKRVKILTARAANPKAIPAVRRWLARQGLPDLEVTNQKDSGMEILYDDRAQNVIKDTGVMA